MATLESIQMKIKKLQAQAEALVAKRASSVIADIRKLMAEYGLTLADLEAHTGKAKAGAKRGPKPGFKLAGKSAAAAPTKKAAIQTKGKLQAKYTNPKTGATWTGHGRAPQWIANVRDRTKFLIAGGADAALAASVSPVSKATTAVKKSSTVADAVAGKAQPKGPQPAKYRDPKSGATWSGRGPAPAWLAAAKDRSTFLIVAASAVAVDAGSASKTKSAAKKAVVKKAVAKTVKATEGPTAKKAAAKKAVSAKQAATRTDVGKKR
jgi:DNA-binding protein H-NS